MGGGKINRNFIVAHSLEARPIIDFYGLSKKPDVQGFDVFEKDQVLLVVSGQGKVNSAAAVGYCAGLTAKGNDPALWVNVGIAGHKHHPIGNLYRANKITDSLSLKSYFPVSLLRTSKINGIALMTVDEQENQYQQGCLYDMEASAYFSTACRITSVEFINSFKIVSDNEDNPLENFKAKDAAIMIESQIGSINEYLNELENKLSNNINKISQNIEFKQKIKNEYHFTHSQLEQVESLVNSLSIHGVKLDDDHDKPSTSKELIMLLNDRLAQIQLMV